MAYVIKETPGFVRQRFDENGNLVWQEFVCSNEDNDAREKSACLE